MFRLFNALGQREMTGSGAALSAWSQDLTATNLGNDDRTSAKIVLNSPYIFTHRCDNNVAVLCQDYSLKYFDIDSLDLLWSVPVLVLQDGFKYQRLMTDNTGLVVLLADNKTQENPDEFVKQVFIFKDGKMVGSIVTDDKHFNLDSLFVVNGSIYAYREFVAPNHHLPLESICEVIKYNELGNPVLTIPLTDCLQTYCVAKFQNTNYIAIASTRYADGIQRLIAIIDLQTNTQQTLQLELDETQSLTGLCLHNNYLFYASFTDMGNSEWQPRPCHPKITMIDLCDRKNTSFYYIAQTGQISHMIANNDYVVAYHYSQFNQIQISYIDLKQKKSFILDLLEPDVYIEKHINAEISQDLLTTCHAVRNSGRGEHDYSMQRSVYNLQTRALLHRAQYNIDTFSTLNQLLFSFASGHCVVPRTSRHESALFIENFKCASSTHDISSSTRKLNI